MASLPSPLTLVPPEPIDPLSLPPSIQTELRKPMLPHHQSPSLPFPLVYTVIVVCLTTLQFGYHMAELNAPGRILSCAETVPHSSPSAWNHSLEKRGWGRTEYKQCIPMTTQTLGLVTSIFPLGGLVGSVYAGKVADRWGRQRVVLANSALYAVGSVVLALANDAGQMAVGRFISGIAAGAALVVTALLIAEVAPTELRGVLGAMNQVSINVGILLTQVLAIRFANDMQWRYLLLMGGALGVASGVMGLFMEESPVWLVKRGDSQAGVVLSRLRGVGVAEVAPELASMGEVFTSTGFADASPSTSFADASPSTGFAEASPSTGFAFSGYFTSPTYRPSLIVTTTIMVAQQFCGINSIIIYSVSVLSALFPTQAVRLTCLISLINTVLTFISGLLLDRLGRRPLLLFSVIVMGLSLFLMAVGIGSHNLPLVVAAVLCYISGFALGLGPVPFLLISEVTQPEVRSVAQSWGTTTNWLATIMVCYLFPLLQARFGGYVYLGFAVVCFGFARFVYTQIPETKGKTSYEEVWAGMNSTTLRLD